MRENFDVKMCNHYRYYKVKVLHHPTSPLFLAAYLEPAQMNTKISYNSLQWRGMHLPTKNKTFLSQFRSKRDKIEHLHVLPAFDSFTNCIKIRTSICNLTLHRIQDLQLLTDVNYQEKLLTNQ